MYDNEKPVNHLFANDDEMRSIIIKSTLIIALFMVLLFPLGAMSAVPTDELQPDLGLFSFDTGLEPYFMSIKESLLGEHRFRMCQVLTIPSFQREWVVYVIREEGKPPTVIYKTMKKHLWWEMMSTIEKQSEGQVVFGVPTQIKALSGLEKKVEAFSAPISEKTARLLADAWTAMLLRVRYPRPNNMMGLDGTTYYVAHVETGKGVWSGNTWSPGPRTNTGILIQIAEDMKNYTTAEPSQRMTLETKIAAKTKRFLLSLKSETTKNKGKK